MRRGSLSLFRLLALASAFLAVAPPHLGATEKPHPEVDHAAREIDRLHLQLAQAQDRERANAMELARTKTALKASLAMAQDITQVMWLQADSLAQFEGMTATAAPAPSPGDACRLAAAPNDAPDPAPRQAEPSPPAAAQAEPPPATAHAAAATREQAALRARNRSLQANLGRRARELAQARKKIVALQEALRTARSNPPAAGPQRSRGQAPPGQRRRALSGAAEQPTHTRAAADLTALLRPPKRSRLRPRLRPAKPGAADAPTATPQRYVVRHGDTLASIARKHYEDFRKWKRILKANRDLIPNPDVIAPGTTLRLP